MKHLSLLFTLILSSLWAQIPDGYYNNANGLNGPALHQALHNIIDGHTVVNYSSLWTHYQTTDVKPNGKVWDMYSDIPDTIPPYEFTFVDDQDRGSGGGSEGEFYNREHSWPKSWFGDVAPMNTDIFHIFPTDKYVNNQRGNYPYGEVVNPSWTSRNGSKIGSCSYPGYTGTVFEPIDPYKGDFARAYFYMSTRYLDEGSGWPGSPMVNGAQLEAWALHMMMEWAMADPVSAKEIDRNNAIYTSVQHNRNPFVDHPEYVDLIWGEVIPPPAAPSDLMLSTLTDSSLELTWTDHAGDETGFYVYQDQALLSTLPENSVSYSVTDLQAATTYSFSVSAYNAAGESERVSTSATTALSGDTTVAHFSEDFEWGNQTSFLEGDFSLASGRWNFHQAGSFSLGTPRSGSKCMAINANLVGAQITTPIVDSLGSISFYYYQRNGAATDEFLIQKSVAGAAFETMATQNYNVGESYTLYSLTLNDTTSAIRIRVLNDNQAGQLIIDDLTLTAVEPVGIHPELQQLPTQLAFTSSFPNPFNPAIQLAYEVPQKTQFITLRIFNLQGELIHTLVHGEQAPGRYQVTWTGSNAQGAAQASGSYIIQLTGGIETTIRRITLLR